MEYTILKTDIQAGIATVTISRPKAMNALNSQFFKEMDHYISEIRSNKQVKALIITGEEKAFVAGADITEMVNMKEEEGRNFSITGQKTFRSLEQLEVPVIAAVNGYALGGGCELAMACDFRIASTKAKFGQPEVNLGLIPGYAGTQRMPRLVGLADALYLLMTAEMIGADDALRIGLVQKVVEPEQLMEETIKIAKTIVSKGPQAVKFIKTVIRQGISKDFESGSRLESEKFGSLFGNEGTEGMKAFLEKRNPNWQS